MSGGRFVNYCKPCYRLRYNRTNGTQRRDAGTAQGRAFGVELEMTGPDRRLVMSALLQAGIDVVDRYAYASTNGSKWELKYDSSVRGEHLELVSPKLRGEAGLRQLETVCAALNSVGATVDSSAGLHVHHDMRNMDVDQIRTQVVAFVERQDLVWRMVAPSRRDNHYCGGWASNQVSALLRARNLREIGSVGPRGNINLHAYPRHGSVEMRCHAGTTNFNKIRAWIHFGQALFAAALASATVSGTDLTQMLVDLEPFGLTTTDASWLLRFETSGETRATVAARIESLQSQMDAATSVLEEVS
jgi:hypothetical protein